MSTPGSSGGGSCGAISWRQRSHSKHMETSTDDSPLCPKRIADDQRMDDKRNYMFRDHRHPDMLIGGRTAVLEIPSCSYSGKDEAVLAGSEDDVKASDDQSISDSTIKYFEGGEVLRHSEGAGTPIAQLTSPPSIECRFPPNSDPHCCGDGNARPLSVTPLELHKASSAQGPILIGAEEEVVEPEATSVGTIAENRWWGSPRTSAEAEDRQGFKTPRRTSLAEYSFEMAARARQISVSPYSFGPGPVNMDESDSESPFLSACSSAESSRDDWSGTPVTSCSNSNSEYLSPQSDYSIIGECVNESAIKYQSALTVEHLPWRGSVKKLSDGAADLYQRRWSEGCVCQ